jgi:hypothetical protein
MIRLSPFVQKIVYLTLIVALLIPLSFIARPATSQSGTERLDTGGQLATLRGQYNLSPAKLGEIDPASETMRLMSLGFRSVAATSLWLNAIDAQSVKDWDRFGASLDTLMKIQPNFHKVWDFQAHNMSYNTSVEFDDYEKRYTWVKKGLDLLRRGLTYNSRDHRFTDTLGRYTGQKIGKSDEKIEFRQLFRYDDDYHASLDDIFDRDSYDAGQYGKDNWMLAYQWFNYSVAMVEQGIGGEKAALRTREVMFYMNRPAQLRNHVISLQTEFPSEESFKFKWQAAHDEWNAFGQRELRGSGQVRISLEGMLDAEIDLRSARKELDQFAPGTRDRLLADIETQINLTEEDKRLLNASSEALTEEEHVKARAVMARVQRANQNIDEMVLAAVAHEDLSDAKQAYNRIADAYNRLRVIDLDRSTINYQFWKERTAVEMSDGALEAHQAFYNAHEKHRSARYADYVAFEPRTSQVKNSTAPAAKVPGAISDFIAGYKFWAEAAKTSPSLENSALFDIMLEDARLVREMTDALGVSWPARFPFQRYVDEHPETAMRYGLPTTEDLIRSGHDPTVPARPSLDFSVEAAPK